MGIYAIVLLVCIVDTILSEKQLYLTSRINQNHEAGIYGCQLDGNLTEHGIAKDLYEWKSYCHSRFQEYKSVSYDTIRNRAIVFDPNSLSIFSFSLCGDDEQCTGAQDKLVYFDSVESQHGIKAVGLHDGEMYFVYIEYEGLNNHMMVWIKQLLCKDQYPFDTNTNRFDMKKCSLGASGWNKKVDEIDTTRPISAFKVFIGPNGHLTFMYLLHTQNVTTGQMFMTLYAEEWPVDPSGIRGGIVYTYIRSSVLIHDSSSLLNDLTRQIGGVDHKEGVVCFAALHTIHCMIWRKSKTNVVTVLDEQKAKLSVCVEGEICFLSIFNENCQYMQPICQYVQPNCQYVQLNCQFVQPISVYAIKLSVYATKLSVYSAKLSVYTEGEI